jgi:hypothetical protein
MGKNRDVVNILILVTIGMFIPFIGSLILAFDIDPMTVSGWRTIFLTFFYFLIIFGIELGFVYVYYNLTNKVAQRSFGNSAPINKKGK